MAPPTGAKGLVAEEALRNYFRSSGYFVVRGIPLNYKNYDVTDVDLWLYVKTTPHTAERACVDVKRRQTPQAMERVLWTKGLKEVLGVDRAIVVTSDNRPETRDFGVAHGVGILQGEFLQRVISTFPNTNRLTEEDLLTLLVNPCVINPRIEWRRWFRGFKAKLLDSLNFDGCNRFLLAVKLLLDEYLATGKSSEVSVRLLYAIVSYFLICLDYTARSIVHLDTGVRTNILTDGFRYGEAGRHRTEEIVQMALQLLAEAGKTDLFSGETLSGEFEKQVSEYRADILGEHFAKAESLKNLFVTARNFEEQAYSKTLLRPHESPSEQKAIIGLICDLLGHDRKVII
jgi:hypothetical protein